MYMGGAKMCSHLQQKKTKLLAINIAAKGVYMLHSTDKTECFIFKSGGGEAFNRGLYTLAKCYNNNSGCTPIK